MYSVVVASSAQQSDSVIHIHISIPFQILSFYRLLKIIECSSACYTIGPCWLSILYMVVRVSYQTPDLSPHPLQ